MPSASLGGREQTSGKLWQKWQAATGICVLICSSWVLFCLLIFPLGKKRKNTTRDVYMTNYQCQNGREKRKKGPRDRKLVKSGFQTTRNGPQGQVLIHFGMHVWCLVFWPAPSGVMLKRTGYTLQQLANDELRTSQKGSLNLAPWLCAQASPGSLSCLREGSGRMGESNWGTLWHYSRELQAGAFLWAHLVFICIGVCPHIHHTFWPKNGELTVFL